MFTETDANNSHQESQPIDTSKEIWVNKFDETSARMFREKVLDRSAMDHNAPIVIYIDSYGGYVDSLANMLATMDEVPNPFITVAVGKACSCGAILLSHGDYRYCDRYSRVMIHEVSAASWGNVRTMKNDVAETLRLNRKFMELLAKNCGMKSYECLKERFKHADADDIWMGPEEAKAFGLVDFVGLPQIRPLIQYQCATLPEKPSRRDPEPKPIKSKDKKMDKKAEAKLMAAIKASIKAEKPVKKAVKPAKKVIKKK